MTRFTRRGRWVAGIGPVEGMVEETGKRHLGTPGASRAAPDGRNYFSTTGRSSGSPTLPVADFSSTRMTALPGAALWGTRTESW